MSPPGQKIRPFYSAFAVRSVRAHRASEQYTRSGGHSASSGEESQWSYASLWNMSIALSHIYTRIQQPACLLLAHVSHQAACCTHAHRTSRPLRRIPCVVTFHTVCVCARDLKVAGNVTVEALQLKEFL
jgi:hypothetical protein